MAVKLPVWGIDVGQCSLKALKLQPGVNGKVELLAFDLVEHDQILSQVEADATDMIDAAIKTFVDRNDLSGSHVVVSVPGQQTLTRFTKMPPVEPKKIPDMVQYEASQQIPFDMDEVVWDYQVFAEGDSLEVEVGIFAIRKELIRSYLSHFTEQGVEPVIVQTSPMASYNAARFELSLPEGDAAILLDTGALSTDLIVMEGDRIWSRPVPIGGNRFTEALVSAFKISFAKAERLKRNAATSKYARQIFQAMRPVFADLVSEIQRSVGFYTSTHREANISRVIGMGNAFKLPGLQKFLHQNLQIKVDKLDSLPNLVAGEFAKKAEFNDNIMSLVVAYGLGLQGIDLASVDSNLLPMEVRRTLLWGRKRPWFIASAVCLAGAAAVMWAGNASAGGRISSEIGDNVSLTPRRFGSADQAMNALNNIAQKSDVQKALDVTGAANRLKQDLADAGKTSLSEGKLRQLAKYPQQNLLVPQIVDAIHRAFGDASSASFSDVESSDKYLRLARGIPREKRKEVWIAQMRMAYSADPEMFFTAQKGGKARPNKQGWAIEITGITTENEPASWLEENLIAKLTDYGREPDKGFHIGRVFLDKVAKRPKRGSAKTKSTGNGRDDRRGAGRRGGGRRGGGRRGGGRGSPRGSGGEDFADIAAPDGSGSPPRGDPGGSVGGGSLRQEIAAIKRDYQSRDPLTGELIIKDYTFKLQIVVLAKKTPKDMIPEAYKKTKDEGKTVEADKPVDEAPVRRD